MPSIRNRNVAHGQVLGMIPFTQRSYRTGAPLLRYVGFSIPMLSVSDMEIYGYGGYVIEGTSLPTGMKFGLYRATTTFEVNSNTNPCDGTETGEHEMPQTMEFDAAGEFCFYWFDKPWHFRPRVAAAHAAGYTASWPVTQTHQLSLCWFNEVSGGGSAGSATVADIVGVIYGKPYFVPHHAEPLAS